MRALHGQRVRRPVEIVRIGVVWVRHLHRCKHVDQHGLQFDVEFGVLSVVVAVALSAVATAAAVAAGEFTALSLMLT